MCNRRSGTQKQKKLELASLYYAAMARQSLGMILLTGCDLAYKPTRSCRPSLVYQCGTDDKGPGLLSRFKAAIGKVVLRHWHCTERLTLFYQAENTVHHRRQLHQPVL